MTTQDAPDYGRELLIVTVRGSTEPSSGSRLLTPIARRIVSDLRCDVARIRELDYPATFVSFTSTPPVAIELGDSPHIGVANLVDLLNGEAERRPHQCVVLLGWSQGALVIGDALVSRHDRHTGRRASTLTGRAVRSIVAVALFGNPAFTAGEPYNEGTFHPGVSGTQPRRRGSLTRYGDRIRDYCAQGDIAAQATPSASVDGHVAYFHNGLPDHAVEFVQSRLQAC
jgi:hypothetical protein